MKKSLIVSKSPGGGRWLDKELVGVSFEAGDDLLVDKWKPQVSDYLFLCFAPFEIFTDFVWNNPWLFQSLLGVEDD